MSECGTGCGNLITDDNVCQIELAQDNVSICNYCCECDEYVKAHIIGEHNYLSWEDTDYTPADYDICCECDCVRHKDSDKWEVMSVDNGFLVGLEK